MPQALITLNAVTGSNPPNGTPLVINTPVACDNVNVLQFLDRANLPRTQIALCCLEHVCSTEGQQRFWSRVEKQTEGGCWIWKGERSRFGHGRFLFLGKRTLAHRYAYELVNGKIPGGHVLCHRCDVPACVNPEHLFVGTQKDNVWDSIHKGRWPVGDTHWCARMPERIKRGVRAGNSKLTEKQVREIYDLCCSGQKYASVAGMYDVKRATVDQIHKGKTWNHITGATRWRARS